jgi:hypothetical protein
MKQKIAIATLVIVLLFRMTSDISAQWVQGVGATNTVYSFAISGSYIFAATAKGVTLSTDDGVSWTVAANTGLTNLILRPLAVSGTNLFAGTFGDGVFRSNDNGSNWVSGAGLKNEIIYSILISGTDLFAAGEGGIFRSSDNGTNWIKLISTTVGFHALAEIGTSIFAANDNGVIRSTDNGAKWADAGSINTLSFFALETNGTDLFVGTYGGVFHSSDTGTSWMAVNTGLTNMEVHSLAVSGTIILAGTAGGIFLSTNSGTSWTLAGLKGNVYGTINAIAIGGGYMIAGCNSIYRRPLSDFGISEVKTPSQPDHNISLSPNPTTGIITVHNASANILHVTVSSILGESVLELEHPNAPEFTLDLSKLPAGTYFARFSLPNEVVTRKIIRN